MKKKIKEIFGEEHDILFPEWVLLRDGKEYFCLPGPTRHVNAMSRKDFHGYVYKTNRENEFVKSTDPVKFVPGTTYVDYPVAVLFYKG